MVFMKLIQCELYQCASPYAIQALFRQPTQLMIDPALNDEVSRKLGGNGPLPWSANVDTAVCM